jgi:hypothetical protein
VTFGEAAGENPRFTADAIVVTAPIAGFPAHFREVCRWRATESGYPTPRT